MGPLVQVMAGAQDRGERGEAGTECRISYISDGSLDLILQATVMQRNNTTTFPLERQCWRKQMRSSSCWLGGRGRRLRSYCKQCTSETARSDIGRKQ